MRKKPQYCGEKWSDLVPHEGGLKCLTCQNILKDFSKKSFKEIEEIQSSAAKPYCGVYTKQQIRNWGQEKETGLWAFGKNKLTRIAMASSLFLSPHPLRAQAEIKTSSPEINQASRFFEANDLPEAASTSSKPAYSIISGVVRDSASQKPLMGVTVFIEELEIGSITDKHGRFRIELVDSLKISFPLKVGARYVGYESKEIEVKYQSGQELVFELTLGNFIEDFYVVMPSGPKRFWWRIKRTFRR